MPTFAGNRARVWTQLTVAAGRITGHVWCLGKRFDVDELLHADPVARLALFADTTVGWYVPAAAEELDLPLVPRHKAVAAILYADGEAWTSVPVCISCGRLPSADETNLPDALLAGEPGKCHECSEIERISGLLRNLEAGMANQTAGQQAATSEQIATLKGEAETFAAQRDQLLREQGREENLFSNPAR
jgi:hypothetical protein